MSEHVLRILVKELGILRITCDACKTAVEIPVDCVQKAYKPMTCPGCQANLRGYSPQHGASADVFDRLAQAIKEIRAMQGQEVEFVLPARAGSASSAQPTP